MNILAVGSNFKTNYIFKNSAVSNSNLKLDSLSYDTVSFTNKLEDIFEDYQIKDIRKYTKKEYSDNYQGKDRYGEEFVDWLLTPDCEDENEMTPIEKAIDGYHVDYLLNTIDNLDCSDESKEDVIYHCLEVVNDLATLAKGKNRKYIRNILAFILNRLPNEKLICEVRDEIGNNILANFVGSNNTDAILLLFKNLDNKTIARLMLQNNIDGEFPVGTYHKFTKSNTIKSGIKFLIDDLAIYKNRKIDIKTLFLLREKAIDIINDENISIQNRQKIYKNYKLLIDSKNY